MLGLVCFRCPPLPPLALSFFVSFFLSLPSIRLLTSIARSGVGFFEGASANETHIHGLAACHRHPEARDVDAAARRGEHDAEHSREGQIRREHAKGREQRRAATALQQLTGVDLGGVVSGMLIASLSSASH